MKSNWPETDQGTDIKVAIITKESEMHQYHLKFLHPRKKHCPNSKQLYVA